MNIIIVGLGNIGETLAYELNEPGNNITVVDVNADKVRDVAERCDVMGVVGNGAVVDSGIVGARFGFKGIINAPTCTFADKGVGFAVPTDSIGIAGRYVKPVRTGGNLIEAGEITDEETGLVMGQRVVVDPGNGEIYWTLETLFGAALMKQTHMGKANGAPGFLALATA